MPEEIKDYIAMDEENRHFAVEARGCNILLAAAAGSGKTTTLVNRIIERLIRDESPVNIEDLLVVTFTKDAAAELRLRIDKELAKVFSQALSDGDRALAERAYRQKLMIPKASIGTIDSFCLDVVKKNYIIAGLDPAFRIDDKEAQVIADNVIDQILEECYEQKGSEKYNILRELADVLCNISSDAGIKNDLLMPLYEFAMGFEAPEQWLHRINGNYSVSEEGDLKDCFWYAYICENLIKVCREIAGYIDEIEAELRGDGKRRGYAVLPDISGYEKLFAQDRTFFVELAEKLGNYSGELFEKIFEYASASSPRATGSVEEKAVMSFVGGLRREYLNYYKKAVNSLLPGYGEGIYSSLNEEEIKDYFFGGIKFIGKFVGVLCELTEEIAERTAAVMKKRRIMNFNTVARTAYKILCEERVAQEYRERFVEIYIDEYQDTSVLQEKILGIVSRKAWGENNTFMVGDVKQSIYGFRNATPEFFIEKYNLYNEKPEEGALKILSRNFRSRKPVLDAVNGVFSAVMKKGVCEIEYTRDEFLNYGAEKIYENKALNDSREGKAELWYGVKYKSPKEGPSDLFREEYGDEMLFVADKILSLFEEGFTVYDRDSGEMRPIRFSDIAIISRNNKGVRNVTRILNAFDVPVSAVSDEKLVEQTEVSVVLDYLRIIDNPYRDYPLVSVLKSAYYGFTDNELAMIRTLSGKHGGNFYESVKLLAENYGEQGQKVAENDKEKTLMSKICRFADDLGRFRKMAATETVSDLVWLVMNCSAFYEKNSSLGQGNLRLLLQQAYPFDSGAESGLYNFIMHMEAVIELEKADFVAYTEASGDSDKVKVMTLHKSKGLEFPVVFLINAGAGNSGSSKNIYLDPVMGIGLSFLTKLENYKFGFIGKPAPMCAIRYKKKQSEFSEEQRLLYVAVTRAREKLFVTATVSADDMKKYSSDIEPINSTIAIKSRNTYVGTIYFTRSCSDGEENWYFGNFSPVAADGLRDGNGLRRSGEIQRLRYETPRENNDIKERNEAELLKSAEEDEAFMELMQQLFTEAENGRLPAKLSVSAVKKMLSEDDDLRSAAQLYEKIKVKTVADVKAFFLDKEGETKGLSATEQGTLIHKCIEHLVKERKNYVLPMDEKAAENYGLSFVKSLEERKILAPGEAEAVDLSFIISYLRSQRAVEIQNAEFACPEASFTYLADVDALVSACENCKIPVSNPEKAKKSVALQGVVDLYYKSGEGEITIVDFKTDRITSENEEDLRNRYLIQLKCYAEALEKITGYTVKECVLMFLRTGQEFAYDCIEKAWRVL